MVDEIFDPSSPFEEAANNLLNALAVATLALFATPEWQRFIAEALKSDG